VKILLGISAYVFADISISTGVYLLAGRPMKRSRLKTGSGVHSASYPVGWELFGRFSARDVKLTTHLRQMPRLRTHGAITPLPIQLHDVRLNNGGVNFVPLNCG